MSRKYEEPGPAKYMLPTTIGYNQHDPRKERKPMYSMRPLAKNLYEHIGPGPASYALETQTRTGCPRNPQYSIRTRLASLKQDLTPGPGAHENHLVMSMGGKRAPQYSFGMRIDLPNNERIPAPNHYDGLINTIRPKAPAYTLRKQIMQSYALDGPGPAKYSLPCCNITYKRSPSYSFQTLHKIPTGAAFTPGPDKYGLMDLQVDTKAPSYSFGIRHPDWKLPMIVPGDNC